MSWLKTIPGEVFGLFVDDGPYAVAILAWLAIVWLVLPRWAEGQQWHGLVLFVGLAAILLASAWRRSRQRGS